MVAPNEKVRRDTHKEKGRRSNRSEKERERERERLSILTDKNDYCVERPK